MENGNFSALKSTGERPFGADMLGVGGEFLANSKALCLQSGFARAEIDKPEWVEEKRRE